MPAEGQPDGGRATSEHAEAVVRRWPWLLPLVAGIFLGAAVFEMMPEALERAGLSAWLWLATGLITFVAVRNGLDLLGRHGMAWAATLGIWLHSFLEGAVTASSYGINLITGLIVSIGLILHLIPEVSAVIALLVAAGLTIRDALIRNGITWFLIVVGFLAVALLLPDLSPAVLGAALAFGAGGFLYLAYASFRERQLALTLGLAVAGMGVLLVVVIRLLSTPL